MTLDELRSYLDRRIKGLEAQVVTLKNGARLTRGKEVEYAVLTEIRSKISEGESRELQGNPRGR